ncbi:MAG: ABC transporter ATP-binding protein [Anaerolineales bacterium]|jgi:putative ABC transport system ATP-binding protein|nr:ABC transporter ATP-binding protein [Anaerolineales bacterium]MCW5887023.1 ABC transporter ATP-binding protein [Anaerolineales bacterium]
MSASRPILDIRDLSKSYQEAGQLRPILRQVSLSIQAGEFVALLGASGSGKSTFLNLISGIDLADSGEIWVQGQNLVTMDETQRTLFRRNHIGFVFQFFNLLPTLTVLENVTLPAELRGTSLKQAQARAQELLAQVGLAERASTFPDRLSGGEQQRVAIARALAHDPLLVLADEPTGNLDEETGTQIMALLEQLTRQAGKNLIMATHNLENARLADRVLRMHEGKLVSELA